MKQTADIIRIGEINYTNVWPILYYFPKEKFNNQLQFVSQVPTKLNNALSEGKLDIAPISSFAYAEAHQKYVLFPDLSVSSFGKVKSILLFHKKPISELVHSKIALPTTSATSVNILKIIFKKFYNGNPEYYETPPVLKEMMLDADAALLIGDDAIKANWKNTSYHVTDLGELWAQLTGSWMTFAVWAVRKEVIQQKPEMAHRILLALQESKLAGLENIQPMILDAQAKVGGSAQFWEKYFSELNYDFGQLQMISL